MDDLIAFLQARLNEDEVAAKAATAGPWSIGEPLPYSDPGSGLSVVSGDDEVAGPGHSGGGVWAQTDADHIVRHDPARVLREVEAKRRIIDCEVEKARERWRRRVDEHRMTFDEWAAHFRWETLRLLAVPYADDHPEYRKEWRP